MSRGKITKEQLSSGLLDYISQNAGNGSGGSSSIIFKKNSVTINSPINRIAIGIDGFDKTKDLLMVYKNTVYLEEEVMYNISSDSLYIQNPNGNWNESGTSLFNFIVIKGSSGSGTNPDNGDHGNCLTEIPNGSVSEIKLSQELKEKLNIGGAKTWGSLKDELAKTWANLMGQ